MVRIDIDRDLNPVGYRCPEILTIHDLGTNKQLNAGSIQ